MSNELVTTGGGAVVPSGGGGGAVEEHVGDMSVDRGAAPPAVANPELIGELQNTLAIDPEQIQKGRELIERHRQALDLRQKQAATAVLRAEWGASGYTQHLRRIIEWLGALPGDLGEEILRARDYAGNLIANKPAALRSMYEVAHATILGSDDNADKAACERALQAVWKGAYHSHVATIKRFLDTAPQSLREGLLSARSDDDVATLNDPAALKWLLQLARPRLEVPRGGDEPAPDQTAINSERRREIEQMMANRNSPYWKDGGATQAEYRDLLERGVSTDLVTRTSDEHLSRRIGEIERWMGARKGSAEYKKYWDDVAVQREYGELLERRERHYGRR